MSVPPTRVQAEHESLQGFLRENLTDHQRARIGLMSFNQWPWTTAALIETAVAAHQVGSDITVAFWCDKTPLRDPGWNTSHRVARLFNSAPIEDSARDLIQAAGVPHAAFTEPPIKRHRPQGLPPLPTPLTRSAIRQLTYQGSGMGRSILQVHPDTDTPSREDYVWPRRWIHRAVRSYAWVYDQTLALINRRDLTTIVVFNGRFTHDRAAAAAAESVGVKVLYYDYGGLETYFDLTHTTTHDWTSLQERMLSMWSSWGLDREQIANTWFRNRQEHTEAGIAAFVGMQKHEFIPDLPQAGKLIVFFSSSPDEIAELDLDWNEYFESQENAVKTLAQICTEISDTALVVRTHPHMLSKPADDRQRWIAAVTEIGNNMHIGPDSPTDSYALMRAADRVITYGSTTGVESAFQGRPVAVLGPSAYDILGCVTPLHTPEQLRQWIIEPRETNREMSLPYGLMMQRRGFNLEWLTQDSQGRLSHDSQELTEASSLVRKISHKLSVMTTDWLTRR